jgi:hypothetical protein
VKITYLNKKESKKQFRGVISGQKLTQKPPLFWWMKKKRN